MVRSNAIVGSAGLSAFTSARYSSAARRSASSLARCAGAAPARSARSLATSAGTVRTWSWIRFSPLRTIASRVMSLLTISAFG